MQSIQLPVVISRPNDNRIHYFIMVNNKIITLAWCLTAFSACDLLFVDLLSKMNYTHGCFQNKYAGLYLWTAGQLVDPKDRSKSFAWKETKTEQVLMIYTKWNRGQPDNNRGGEGCVNLWPGRKFEWNDQPCDTKTCFVCEYDK